MSISGQVSTSTSLVSTWIVTLNYCDMSPGDCVKSPSFFTIINDTKYEWQLSFYPRGIDAPSMFTSVYLQNLTSACLIATIKFSIFDEKKKRIGSYFTRVDNLTMYSGLTKFVKQKDLFDCRKCREFTIFCEIVTDDIKYSDSARKTDPSKERFFSKLQEDLETLVDDEKHSDVKFIINAKELKAHKCILIKRSPVFAAMFEHDTMEKKTNVIEIKDIEYDVLKEMLRFIYTGKVNDIKTNAKDLLKIADKYILEGMKTMCEETLCENLSVKNVVEYLGLAYTYNAELLKTKAIKIAVSSARGKLINILEFKALGELDTGIMYNLFSASISEDNKSE